MKFIDNTSQRPLGDDLKGRLSRVSDPAKLVAPMLQRFMSTDKGVHKGEACQSAGR